VSTSWWQLSSVLFDGIDVNENALDFLWPLAIWVIGSIGQALQDYGRGA